MKGNRAAVTEEDRDVQKRQKQALALTAALLAIFAIAVARGPAPAEASVRTSDLSDQLDGVTYVIPSFVVGTSTGSAVGSNGMLVSGTLNNAGHNITWTTSIAQPPYPSRYLVRTVEASATSANVYCSQVQITGRTWDGRTVTETFTKVQEATRTSTYSYEKLTKVVATGCVNNLATGQSTGNADRLKVYASTRYAMPVVVRSSADIVSVCKVQRAMNGSNTEPKCLAQSTITALTVGKLGNSINLGTVNFQGTTAANGDTIIVRVRGNRF